MRALVNSIIFLIALSVCAQQKEETSIIDILKRYEEALSITFSYDPELLALIESDHVSKTSNFEEFRHQLESNHPFQIVEVDTGYYTISAIETLYKVGVADSTNNDPITEGQGVQVLINRTPIETEYEDGAWVFSYQPDIADVVEIYSDGYIPTVISTRALLNKKNLNISLGLRTKYLSTVVIENYITKGINLNPSDQQIKINVDDLPLLPGDTDGDIFASIAALPGITTPDGRAGNLFIRGSETDQSLILFDNIPVYHRGHYYGTISPYNPKIVKNVEVYRSGFHPRLGDRVGGAIIINSDQALEKEKSRFGAGANTLFGTAYGKTPISKKWGISFGARRSYSRDFESPKLQAISESVFAATAIAGPNGRLTTRLNVLFEDYHGKISFAPNKNNAVSFTTLYTNTEVVYSPLPQPNSFQRTILNKFDNFGLNALWEAKISNLWKSTFSATYSNYHYQFNRDQAGPPPNQFFSRNRLKDINISQELARNGEWTDFQLGVDYKWQEVDKSTLVESQPNSSLFRLDQSNQSHSVSPFMNIDYYGWNRWFFQFGVRSTYYSALKDYRIAPRFLVNYDLADWVTLKGSAGLYNQYLSQVKNLDFGGGGFENELWTLADNESGFIIHGSQSTAGAVINFDKWVFDLEAFNKTANNITVYEERFLNSNSIYFTMDQQTSGVDLLLKREVSSNASIWLGYSYHDSEISLDTTDQVTYSSKYVQPHVWYMGGALKKNRWKLSAGWKYSSGLNAQSLDIIYARVVYERQAAQNPDNPPPNPFENLPERYPNVYQLDISASYSIPKSEKRKWNASFGLSLINVFDQENLTDQAFRDRDGFLDRNAIGFAPNLMVLFEW